MSRSVRRHQCIIYEYLVNKRFPVISHLIIIQARQCFSADSSAARKARQSRGTIQPASYATSVDAPRCNIWEQFSSCSFKRLTLTFKSYLNFASQNSGHYLSQLTKYWMFTCCISTAVLLTCFTYSYFCLQHSLAPGRGVMRPQKPPLRKIIYGKMVLAEPMLDKTEPAQSQEVVSTRRGRDRPNTVLLTAQEK